MGNTVSLDNVLKCSREARKRLRSRTSPTCPESEANEDDNNNFINSDDPGTKVKTSDNILEEILNLVDTRVGEMASDSDSQEKRTELRALMLSELADILESKYERAGTVEWIERAINLRCQALSLTSERHMNMARLLNELGVSLRRRFDHVGERADVDKAIECHIKAVSLTPEGHADKPSRLDSLGNSYARRFERFGELADVDKAIQCQGQAVLLIPEGHANKSSGLNNLGNSYQCRFERLGELGDVDKAIEYQTQASLLMQDGDANKPSLLGNLGIAYTRRFERLGKLGDVDKAIEWQTQAVLLTSDGDANKPILLNNLGNSHEGRFERFGEVIDVDKAIEYRPSWLNNLGISYLSRFKRLGELVDVDKAIGCQAQALLLMPDGVTNKPNLLNNLGNSYQCRFERLGKLEDLDKAIEYQTQAMLLIPDGHVIKPIGLNNLGNSYQCRFERLGELIDLNKAIECQTQAVLLTLNGHADKPGRLNNLGLAYQARFERLREISDVGKAIEYQTQAVLLTPDGHAGKATWLGNLGGSYMRRFECLRRLPDLESAQSSFKRAALHMVTNPRTQIWCTRRWAECCSSLGVSPLPAYERCMELVPHLIWLGTTINQRYTLLATISDLAAEAASWSISVRAYDLAIEWLEQGRSVVWNQILQLRTPFGELAACNPALYDRLISIAAQLEGAGTRATETFSTSNAPSSLEKDAQHHRRLADEWEKALEEARNIPGFESFLRPRKAEELKRSATDGPIVLINAHSSRCDALIVFPRCEDIAHLPLTGLSLDKAAEFREQLYSSIRHRGDSDRGFTRVKRMHEPNDPFKSMLSALWSTIVKPVLDAIACTRKMDVDELLHVTWCATGALAFLPLHAAGPYDGTSPNAYDIVISSYTPTLSALLSLSIPTPTSEEGVLAVGQEDTRGLPPLPCTVQELAAIDTHAKSIRYHQLDGRKATVNAVLHAMDDHSWIHLACHASQNPRNPAQSSFHLHDGNLTLETITKRQFKNKGLAFLSACQTATGDDNLPDEAVHLAAGMLMAGYPSVIATMWPIRDADGPEVASRVYAELLKGGKMDHKGAARALHKAVAGLREKIGENSSDRWQWVPFIHLGV